MREIAHQNVCLPSFFRVLPTRHSRGHRTHFHGKHFKQRGSEKERAFSGLENKFNV